MHRGIVIGEQDGKGSSSRFLQGRSIPKRTNGGGANSRRGIGQARAKEAGPVDIEFGESLDDAHADISGAMVQPACGELASLSGSFAQDEEAERLGADGEVRIGFHKSGDRIKGFYGQRVLCGNLRESPD